MASENSALLNTHGDIVYGECRDVTLVEPVSIMTPHESIRVETSDDSRKFLSVTFTTIEKDGLLLYTSGQGYVCTVM